MIQVQREEKGCFLGVACGGQKLRLLARRSHSVKCWEFDGWGACLDEQNVRVVLRQLLQLGEQAAAGRTPGGEKVHHHQPILCD